MTKKYGYQDEKTGRWIEVSLDDLLDKFKDRLDFIEGQLEGKTFWSSRKSADSSFIQKMKDRLKR